MSDLPAQAVSEDASAPWWKQRARWLYAGLVDGELRDHDEWGDVRYPLHVHSVGRLATPAGAVVAADPYLVGDEGEPQAFEQRLGADSAEVTVARAVIAEDHERVAALALVVGSQTITDWRMATLPGQDTADLGHGDFFGYGVDAGTGSFGSPEAMRVVGRVMQDDAGMLEDPVSEALQDTPAGAVVVAPEPGATPIAACASGWGDGSYPTWIGIDAAGEVVVVVTDFLVAGDPYREPLPDPDASTRHPASGTRFPPDDDESLAGGLMTEIAIGLLDRDELRERIEELIEGDEFAEVYPDETAPSLEDAFTLLDRLRTVHDRVVEERSADRTGFDNAVQALAAAGVAMSVGDGFDAGEGARAGYERASAMAHEGGRPAHGYAYIHQQDLRRVVLDGRLLIGFSDLAGEHDDGTVSVGRMVAGRLRAAGLSVHWDGTAGTRILVAPMLWAAPFDGDGPTMVVPARDLLPGGEQPPSEPRLIAESTAGIMDLIEGLLTTDLPDEWIDEEHAGVDLLHTPGGHVLGVVGIAEGEDPDGEILPARSGLVDDLVAALTERYGAPTVRAPLPPRVETAAWVDLVMGAAEAEEALVWAASEDLAVGLMTRRARQVLEASLLVLPTSSLTDPLVSRQSVGVTWDDFAEGASLTEIRSRVERVAAASGVAPLRTGSAVRHGWSADGCATAWWFTDDGRALVAWFDPESNLVQRDVAEMTDAEALAQAATYFDGVPDDLRALATDAPGDLLPNLAHAGSSVHRAVGVVWYDREQWVMADGWLRAASAVEDPDPRYVTCILDAFGFEDRPDA